MRHDVEPVIFDHRPPEREERSPLARERRGGRRGGSGFDALLRQALGDALLPEPRSPVFPRDSSGAPTRRGDGLENVWQQAGARFDPRCATFEELAQLALLLYRQGAVSVLEYLLLASSPEDETAAFGDVLFTPADDAGRCDWIAEFEARREAARYYGHFASVESMERVLDGLKRVEAARGGPVAASA